MLTLRGPSSHFRGGGGGMKESGAAAAVKVLSALQTAALSDWQTTCNEKL